MFLARRPSDSTAPAIISVRPREGIIQFPKRQQTGIGSDVGTVELQLKTLVEIEPKSVRFRFTCAFRRSRPGIPSEGGRLYRLKPAGDSDDPGHLLRRALVSTSSSGQLAGSASSL